MEAKREENGKTIYAKLEINGNIKEEAVILSQGAVEIFNEKGSSIIEKGAIVIAQNNSPITIKGRVKEIAVIDTQGNFKATAVNDGAMIYVPEKNIRIDHDKRQKPEASGYNREYVPYVESINTEEDMQKYRNKHIGYVKNMRVGGNPTYNISDSSEMLKMQNHPTEYRIYDSKLKKEQDSYYIGDGENKKRVSKEEYVKITGQPPEQLYKDYNISKSQYHFYDGKQSSSSDVEDASAQPHQKHGREK